MKKVFCAALIVCGIALDTYFYAFRFTADGLRIEVAVVAGVALELLLAFAVYNAQRSKVFVLIAVAITAYAVIQTSAGQTFALLSHNVNAGAATASSTTDFTLVECKKTIARLSSEAEAINSQLCSLQSTEARAEYAGTIYRATQRLNEIARERARNMDILLKTSTGAVTEARAGEANKSIYNFYANIPNWKGNDWLKFTFHFILSVLIAIMAPVGIISWGSERAVDRMRYTRQQIEMFAAAAWYKIRNNTSASILSEVEYCSILQKRGIAVEAGVYFALTNRCIQYRLINTSGVAIEKDHQKVIKILAGEKESLYKRCKKWINEKGSKTRIVM